MASDEIVVKSHVGRDLLQSAQLFKSAEAAIWEYVVNSFEYVEPGLRPEVAVRIDKRAKRVTISDNGRGMNVEDLRHYFTMHGENRDRRKGMPGRGKFGTGKSAAFGIANVLEVSTVRDGKKNVVRLSRPRIEASDGSEIPIEWITKDEPVTVPNGTIVVLEDLFVRKLSPDPVVRLIERHLGFWRGSDPKVVVDTHVCEPLQPPIAFTRTFWPSPIEAKEIGEIELVVHAAQAPLDPEFCGVAVTTAPGALVAIETAGIERKEFGDYLFGEIECPRLDAPGFHMAAYDATRSLQLNYQHPVAGALVAFIGRSLDEVRAVLVAENKKRKEEQEFKELEREADRIAELLNQDLAEVRDRFEDLQSMRRRQGSVARAGDQPAGGDGLALVEGDDAPGLLDPIEPPRNGPINRNGSDDPKLGRQGNESPSGPDRVSPGGDSGQKKKPRGGLVVEYRNLGADDDRGKYNHAERAILINLDHPMVDAAKRVGGVEDIAFTRISYEIAFTTYALGLTQELLKQDPDLSGDDVLYECRDALRRVTRKAANLYSSVRSS